ncbi:MAG: peptidoglycan DD-metalloendopeptidase family protein [Actinomycetota bacterium]|nr:peptidoglycan DD-metalloendopeptidase family protein [Actinomycetota bacterium]
MTRKTVVLALVFLTVFVPLRAVAGEHWEWPLDSHEVGREFDLPDDRYGAGNRGVDLRGQTGDEVRSVAAGEVSFVGIIAHVRIVVVNHGRERSTYQPVAATVRVGDAVTAGQPIGTLLGAGSHCDGGPCLHLGRKVGDDYLDPLALMTTSGRFQLINPEGPPPPPPFGAGGSMRRPVGGPITSPFGMRVHPITGARKLHNGTDFGVPCGTPVHAAGSGTVVSRGFSAAYGNRVILRHQGGLRTSYNHLRSRSVAAGERVGVGDVIGRSGTSGLSTGCHLHFMVEKGGKPINPMGFV